METWYGIHADNAPIHTAKIIKDWFCEQGIPLVDWRPYSPDLNPIEHARAIKRAIFQGHGGFLGESRPGFL